MGVLPTPNFTSGWSGWPIRQILSLWGAKFHKMGEYLPRTPINHRAKFEAASYIFAEEIRHRTNKQTNTQTVNDISTLCLSACVDNNITQQLAG